MNIIPIAKTIVGFVSGAGAATIVSNVARATSPAEMGKIQKIILGTGSVVLGGLVGKKTADYSEEMIDDVVETVKSLGSKEKKTVHLPY